jgi:hypothetical protein
MTKKKNKMKIGPTKGFPLSLTNEVVIISSLRQGARKMWVVGERERKAA